VRLETERLILRKPELGDVDGYAKLWGDPEVVRFLGGQTQTPEEVPTGIERMLKHWERHGVGLFSVLRKEDERLIGRVGYLLWDSERWANAMHEELEEPLELEIGWVVARAFWGQGYATEAAAACRDHAFGSLGRDRVISLIAPANVASIRVAEKIGERYERDVDIGAAVGPVGVYALQKTA
jgi:[ribosomal protein S5]-alanine N-acetyltransferase